VFVLDFVPIDKEEFIVFRFVWDFCLIIWWYSFWHKSRLL